MALYNLSGLENDTTIVELFTEINTITSGWLVIMILISVFIIVFIATKFYDSVTALRSAGLATTVLSIGFWSIGLLSTGYLLIPAIVVSATIIYDLSSRD